MKNSSKLHRLMQKVVRDAIRHFKTNQGEIIHQIICQKLDGSAVVALGSWANPEEKILAVVELKQFLKENGIVRYVSLSEAWAVTGESSVRPSLCENRLEMCQIVGVDDETGEKIAYMFPILRDANNKRSAGKLEGPMPVGGFMTELFEDDAEDQ